MSSFIISFGLDPLLVQNFKKIFFIPVVGFHPSRVVRNFNLYIYILYVREVRS